MSHQVLQEQQAERLLDAWRTPTGWRYWSAVNNTIVGLWYVAVTFIFFLFGGVLALLMRFLVAVGMPCARQFVQVTRRVVKVQDQHQIRPVEVRSMQAHRS